MRLMTMHGAKGLEFEAVALVGLHEKQIPYGVPQTPEELDEARRLFYVAITRAKRFLLYITEGSNGKNTPTRFLGKNGLNLLRV
jgi:DNA helicase-2/ATP-dependent DNA helicase PcrA